MTSILALSNCCTPVDCMAALPQWLVDFLKGLGKAREVNGREGVEER